MHPLSDFQLKVLQYAAHGYTSAMTGEALGKTCDNVRRARQIVRHKLGVRSMPEAVDKAKRAGYRMTLPRLPSNVDEWVREWQIGHEFVEHWRGVPWDEAPIPDARHVCQSQTRGVVRVPGLPPMPVMRCACGAARIDDAWEWRNMRAEESAVRQSDHAI